MVQSAATRSELLGRRHELEIAQAGRDLLDDKRQQLLEEFRKVADQVLARAEAVADAAADAVRALAIAEGGDGPEAVRSAALAGRSEIPLQTGVTTVMGVKIAEIEIPAVGRRRTERGFSMHGSTARIDRAAAVFEAEVQLLLELAAREQRLRRLVDEMSETTRRLNALDFVVVPDLEHEVGRIQSVLDERERQHRFRQKRAMARREARRKSAV